MLFWNAVGHVVGSSLLRFGRYRIPPPTLIQGEVRGDGGGGGGEPTLHLLDDPMLQAATLCILLVTAVLGIRLLFCLPPPHPRQWLPLPLPLWVNAGLMWASYLALVLPTLGLVVQHGVPIMAGDRYTYLPSLLLPLLAGSVWTQGTRVTARLAAQQTGDVAGAVVEWVTGGVTGTLSAQRRSDESGKTSGKTSGNGGGSTGGGSSGGGLIVFALIGCLAVVWSSSSRSLYVEHWGTTEVREVLRGLYIIPIPVCSDSTYTLAYEHLHRVYR